MLDYTIKTLVILPHLDDEFALAPLIGKLKHEGCKGLKFIYCAERYNDDEQRNLKRREENLKSLKLFGYSKRDIIYLNDFFTVEDLKLYKSLNKINQFLYKLTKKHCFKQIITLNFEGGHPDHDALAMLIYRFNQKEKVKTIFIPAYNYKKTFFIPFSVFRPLDSQKDIFKVEYFSYFCWFKSLQIAFLYKTERKAFIKLIPFIIYRFLFSYKIYYSSEIDINSVSRRRSFTSKRYKVEYGKIFKAIEGIQ